MATKLITLKQAQLFEVSTALAKAYRNTFSADTISRASQYVEGSKNPSRNYIWGIIMNTQGKAGKLSEVYSKETANSLCKLTLYKLAQPQAESVSTDAF
mgnify:FL=1